jgi:histone deacetylase 1/2
MMDSAKRCKRNTTLSYATRHGILYLARPASASASGKWVLKDKLHPDGSLEQHKACWILCDNVQRAGVDFDQTFSPIVKLATIRMVLTLAEWPIHQLDVSNAFLHDELMKTVYCQQPTGFVNNEHPDYVCLLYKSMYGLRQAPRVWYQKFRTHVRSLSFVTTGPDMSLFVLRHSTDIIWLLLYVNDIILKASSTTRFQRIIQDLRGAFAVKDLGPLHYFLGIQDHRTVEGFILHQQQYVEDILDRVGMLKCKPVLTLVDTKAKVSVVYGVPLQDKTFYRSITSALQYPTLTRPELAYDVQQACLHMHDPHEVHWNIIKCVMRYVCGTTSHGVLLRTSSSTTLMACTDVDWVGFPNTCRSTSEKLLFLGLPSGRPSSRAPPPKLSTQVLQMLLPSVAGCRTFFASSLSS